MIGFNPHGCKVGIADFESATFTGDALLGPVTFDMANVESVTFTGGEANFESASFIQNVPAEVERFLPPEADDAEQPSETAQQSSGS